MEFHKFPLTPYLVYHHHESDTYQTRISPRINKNRSKNSKFEEPMDVEPLEKSSIKKSQESISNDKKLLDIEDPW